MSRRVSPLMRFFSVTIAKPTRFMQEPINYEIHCNGEKRDGGSGIERCGPAEADQRLTFRNHRTPVGGRWLNTDAKEGKRGNCEKYETEAQAKLGDQRWQNVGHDFPENNPAHA